MTSAGAPRGVLARYRAWYERLPVQVQLIGLQLWMPVFFVFAFVFCYVFAFHAPAFKNVPVAVVGPVSAMHPVAEQLETSSKGAVIVSVVPSLAAARTEVRDGQIAAAYAPAAGAGSSAGSSTSTSQDAPGGASATLVIASADSYQLSSLAKSFFQGVATQQKAVLTADDLAPLPARDSFGTSLFYLTLVVTITSHLTAMFVGMMGGGLRHWQRFAIFGSGAILLPGVTMLLARFVIHAVSGHFLWLWAIGSATGFAVGCVVNGLAYFFGRFIAGAALLLFVFANVPGSGGAYPPELLPQPFRWLHNVVTGTATVDLLRKHEYGVGPPQWQGWLLLAIYAAVGVCLAFVGKPYAKWKGDRAKALGKPHSMMLTAQARNLINIGVVAPLPAGPRGEPGAAEPVPIEPETGPVARPEPEQPPRRRRREEGAGVDGVGGDAAAAGTGAAG